METKDKLILITDLCARLPYGVRIKRETITGSYARIEFTLSLETFGVLKIGIQKDIYSIKPYLRPMSSMTDEEREEWADLFNLELDKLNEIDDDNKAEELAPYYFGKSHQVSIDWLNAHHFDYRGLIEKGLALEAPYDMYKNV